MPKGCRSTQHCAYHGWCRRCHGQLAALMSEINLIIQSSNVPPESWGELYGRLGKSLHGDDRAEEAMSLAEARAAIRRLNCRAQDAEARLVDIEHAVGEWRVDEDSVFLPLSSLMTISRTVGKTMEAGRLVSYHQKIEELQAEVERLKPEKEEEGEQ